MKLIYCVRVEGNRAMEGYFEDGATYKSTSFQRANKNMKRLKKLGWFRNMDGRKTAIENVEFTIQFKKGFMEKLYMDLNDRTLFGVDRSEFFGEDI